MREAGRKFVTFYRWIALARASQNAVDLSWVGAARAFLKVLFGSHRGEPFSGSAHDFCSSLKLPGLVERYPVPKQSAKGTAAANF